MWLHEVDKKEVIQAIYKDKLPSLSNLHIRKFYLTMGQDVDLSVQIDLSELPEILPPKWAKRQVNTIRTALEFLSVEIEYFAINKVNHRAATIFIDRVTEKEITKKKVICIDNMQNKIFELKTRWIFITGISGYHNENKLLNSSKLL